MKFIHKGTLVNTNNHVLFSLPVSLCKNLITKGPAHLHGQGTVLRPLHVVLFAAPSD